MSFSLLIWYLLSCQHDRAALLVGREVLAPMGVANMYKQFLAHCSDEILETLLLFTNPDNYPIQIHCTQGKDRTGLISCLLLSMAGVPEDIIVKDYAKTQAGLAPIRKDMINDLKRVGLSEEFADAPPKVRHDLGYNITAIDWDYILEHERVAGLLECHLWISEGIPWKHRL